MGNQQCCQDKTKAGEFNKGPKPTRIETREPPKKNTQFQSPVYANKPQQLQRIESYGRKQIPQANRNNSSSILNPNSQLDSRYNSKVSQKEEKQILPINSSRQLSKQQQIFTSRAQNKFITLTVPQVNPYVQKTYITHRFFTQKQGKQLNVREYGGEIYEGQLDGEKKFPSGFGQFHKRDQSLYVGQFVKGRAHGNGVYIFPDGSYYQGQFFQNMANSENALYYSQTLTYRGSFKNNLFHGNGQQSGPNHKFKGVYTNGYKSHGLFQWVQQHEEYVYQGSFNQKGEFHGNGKLTEPSGVYQGQFQNGFKHGHGVYKFANGIRYEGHYQFNKRQGKGKIINPNNKLAYDGQFLDGLPNGEGLMVDQDGKTHMSKWIMGIDSEMIAQSIVK